VCRRRARCSREGGYVVLRAHDAGRSTEHRRTSSRTHSLLLTDVLSPGMNGIVLAERVRLGWPHTKLFISGVARDNLQTGP
jgi:DNA-binding response OmpR family regulator